MAVGGQHNRGGLQQGHLAGEGQTVDLKCSLPGSNAAAKFECTRVHENAVWPASGPQNCITPGSDVGALTATLLRTSSTSSTSEKSSN